MSPIERLLDVMVRLRDPKRGCPWDLEQDFDSIAPYTIEEAYEVADAIAKRDTEALRDELGDLLLQVAYHAQMAKEAGHFDFDAVALAVADKMIERHPHVFGSSEVESAHAQSLAWEEAKAAERAERAAGRAEVPSLLDDLPLALPALMRAQKLQKRAARGGFDWPEAAPVLDKLDEETGELRAELAARATPERLEDEVGDLLFTVVNLARHLRVDAESALRHANHKFERRFRTVEHALAEQGRRPADATLDELEGLWQASKSAISSD
jgi:nucleoside triphosphate diphosphatase